jgi:tetratricopeptide (TPR) repeat protein
MSAPDEVNLDDVHRRDMLKLAGAVAAGTGVLNNPPWERLSEAMAGRRGADNTTVTMIENKTAEFFRSEETTPARQLVRELRGHFKSLRDVIETTEGGSLRRRLFTCLGQTEALAGWTLFDMQRNQDAVRLYRNSLESAKEAGDTALATCVMGYWSYLLGGQGENQAAARMLTDASEQIRGGSPVTQAWVIARRAEELALSGEYNQALRALDQAITIYDYAPPGGQRRWTCFFTPTRFGSLAVSTYGRMNHPETEGAARVLLRSMAPTENKVKSLVLADLATSAAKARDYDRVQALAQRSAHLALRTECSLTIDRLWDLAEVLPGTLLRDELVAQLMARAGTTAETT